MIAILLGIAGIVGTSITGDMDYQNNYRDIFAISSATIIFIGLFFLIRFFLSFKRTLTISTASESITSNIAGLEFDDVTRFVNKIEKAREERIIALSLVSRK